MTAPGSTASPTGTAYPNLASRGTGFSEYGLGCWGGWGGNKIPSGESWEHQSDKALVRYDLHRFLVYVGNAQMWQLNPCFG